MITRKYNSVYLFLALACFLGIVIIFVVDGYLGIYDTLVINNGQYTQTIASDQWGQPKRYGETFTIGIPSNGSAGFTYTIENHRFSTYDSNLEVTLWYNEEKEINIYETPVSISAFSKKDFQWKLSTADILPSNRYSTGTIKIIINGTDERQVKLNIYSATDGIKTIPPVPVVTITPP
jgi:hypothetical protein